MLNSLLSVTGTIISIVIGVAAVIIVAATIITSIRRKKQGKGGCDCGCANCAHNCYSNNKEKDK